MNIKNVIIGLLFSFFAVTILNAADEKMKNTNDENLRIELRFVNGEALSRIAPNLSESIATQKYIIGKITNLHDRKVTLQISIRSPNNSSVFVESLNISWIPAKATAHFVHYLGVPSLDTSESNVQLVYEIAQKMIK